MNDKEIQESIRIICQTLQGQLEREKSLHRALFVLREMMAADARYDSILDRATERFPLEIDAQIQHLRQLVRKLSSSRKDFQS